MVTAKNDYNKTKSGHEKHIETFLKGLASALKTSGKGTKASNMKQLQLQEQ